MGQPLASAHVDRRSHVRLPLASDAYAAAAPTPLPAWPLLAMLYGFPVYWITGVSLFVPLFFGTVMAAFMVLRGHLRAVPGTLCWAALLCWIAVCLVSVTDFLQFAEFAQRLSDLVAVGISAAYYANARETLRLPHLLRGFIVIWTTVVVLGVLATQFPNFRLTTPLVYIVPRSLLNNEVMYEFAMPRLAEVQDPWGAEEPFVRPAAPFPYTNSWGMAYALLTPVMLLVWTRLSSRPKKFLLALALAVSVYPAAQTSNRGMLIALVIFALFVAARFMIAGSVRTALRVLSLLAASTAAAAAAGVFSLISERQAVSHTTSGRGEIYRETFEKTLQSPVVGWATPSMDPSIGIALGTQGYAWTLMFCYGFLGLVLFYVFLSRVLLATWRLAGTTAYVLQGIVATVGCTIWFYGLGTTQCLILVLAASALARAAVDGGDIDG